MKTFSSSLKGLADDEDKQAITELGVQQVQNGIASIDEVRDRLDLAPWGLSETSEPVVFTAQGPVPFSMARSSSSPLKGEESAADPEVVTTALKVPILVSGLLLLARLQSNLQSAKVVRQSQMEPPSPCFAPS